MKLQGKTAVITRGNSGIGFAAFAITVRKNCYRIFDS